MGNLFSREHTVVQPNLYDDLMIEYKQQIAELQKQNKALQQLNKELRKELHNRQHVPGHAEQMPVNASVSTDVIKQYVSDMLEKEECNIGYIPDFVERQLYEKMFGMLLGLLEHTIETTSVNFMGHQIRFYLTRPIEHRAPSTENCNETMGAP